MYANDILLLCSSIVKLHLIVDICVSFGIKMGATFSYLKSNCLAINPGKIRLALSSIQLSGNSLNRSNKLRDFGIFIIDSSKNLFNLNEQVGKFHVAIHSVVSNCGLNKEFGALEILKRKRIPILFMLLMQSLLMIIKVRNCCDYIYFKPSPLTRTNSGLDAFKEFAPPLRTQLDGTFLKSAPNPHQKSISPTYRSIQRFGRPKQARDHISPKIGDRWLLSQVDSHLRRKSITLPPRAGPTHHPSTYVAQGEGGVPCVSSFAQNSNRTRLELYAIPLVNITRPLIQPFNEFLDTNLGWKRD